MFLPTPTDVSISVGLRPDGGDAETGAPSIEFGTAPPHADPALGFSVVRHRTHAACPRGTRQHISALSRTRPDLAYAKQADIAGKQSRDYLPYLILARYHAVPWQGSPSEVESSLGLGRFTDDEP